jgi:hypothetical protein
LCNSRNMSDFTRRSICVSASIAAAWGASEQQIFDSASWASRTELQF